MIATASRLRTVKEYYFSTKLREVRQRMNEGHPVINMGIGSPDMAPPQQVVEALTTALHQPTAHQYQSYQGLPELRSAMADFYQNWYGVALDPQQEILPLMGSKEGIMHISMAYLEEGDEVLIPDPGYPTYATVTRLVGASPVYYPLVEENNWLPDLKALMEQDLSKVKIMWVNYPHMPTGALAKEDLYKELIAFAKEHRILLVNDNPYSFILSESPLSLLAVRGAKEVALELNSLSKTFNMAGWRMGMVVGDAQRIKDILKVKSNMDSGMFYGIQKGAMAALAGNKDWFTELNKEYRLRRKGIWQIAEALGCSYDMEAVGMFVWAKLQKGHTDAEAFIDRLLYEKNLFIAPGTVFGSHGQGYIRFSLCVPNDKIEEALYRIKN